MNTKFLSRAWAITKVKAAKEETPLKKVLRKTQEFATKMDKVEQGSAEYRQMQIEMQKLLREKSKLDPEGNSKFDFKVWKHSGKPARRPKRAHEI